MEILIYRFVFPFLACLTALFLILIFWWRFRASPNWKGEDVAKPRGAETKEASSNLIPKTETQISKIDESRVLAKNGQYIAVDKSRATVDHLSLVKQFLITVLSIRGLVSVFTEDPLLLAFGMPHAGLKISFLVRYFSRTDTLQFESFAFRVVEEGDDLAGTLNALNSSIEMACLYERDMQGNRIVFNKYTIHHFQNNLSADLVEDIVTAFLDVHVHLDSALTEVSLKTAPIYIEHFVDLHNSEVDIYAEKEENP